MNAAKIPSRVYRQLVLWSMVGIVVLSLLVWYATRDTLPRNLSIATAATGGLYHKVGTILAQELSALTDRPVSVEATHGTLDNCRELHSGNADIAILQAGVVDMEGLTAIAPLYHDVVIVIIRKGMNIDRITNLAGKKVALGLPRAGMRLSSGLVLSHYDLSPDSFQAVDAYFLDMLSDDSIDAAIVTTGLLNPDLEKLLGTGEFELLGIDEGGAFCMRHPSFGEFNIPRGLFGHRPPLPDSPVRTVATSAFLAGRADVSARLVRSTLRGLYETDLRSQVPTLISNSDAASWQLAPLHPASRTYLDPYGGIDTLASLLESLAAGKELLFALAAGIFLMWDRYKRMRERERQVDIQKAKERLDELLAETTRIEQAQIDTTDLSRLKVFLDDVTSIKLRALEELTHEDLRSDRMFLIFLMQCGNVINKIQAKMLHAKVSN